MGLLHLQRVTAHWGAVISPCFTMEKPSTELRWKMGQGLLFHAQLDVLMLNHAEFMCYSMMDRMKIDYHGNFQGRENLLLSSLPSLSLPLCIYPPVCLSFWPCFPSLHLPPHLLNIWILNICGYFQRGEGVVLTVGFVPPLWPHNLIWVF